MFTARWR